MDGVTNMFRKIADALRRFMMGRYGTDKLNQWLLGAAVVLLLISLIGSRFAPWMAVLVDLPDVLAQHRGAPPGKRRVPALFQPPDG